MEPDSHEIRCVLLNCYSSSYNADTVYEYLCFSYTVQVLKELHCRNWFEKFKKGNFEVNNASTQGGKIALSWSD